MDLALWIWTGDTGIFSNDFFNLSAAICFAKQQPTLGCGNFTAGIGNSAGTASAPVTVGLTQVSIVQRFVGVNWVSAFDWRNSPPQGMAGFPPTLLEGGITLAPSGCTVSFNDGGG